VKKFSLALVSILLLTSGCATQGYVKQQTDPLACRLDILESKGTTLESRLSALETKASDLESRLSALPTTLELTPADRALVSDAARTATESAQRAENAATSAAASASAADHSAQRAAKAFELGQKK